MKKKRISYLPISKSGNEYFDENQNKIELARCPYGGEECKKVLSIINKNFVKSKEHHLNKEFQGSIGALKIAYINTNELKYTKCNTCVQFFRSTIMQSLEDIRSELQKMSTGIMKTNRYQESYLMAGIVLKEFKKES